MKNHDLHRLISVFVIFASALSISFGQGKEVEKSFSRKLRVNDIKFYRQMNRVNRKPVVMDEATSKLCGRQLVVLVDASPHSVPGVVYYINDIAQKGLGTFKEKKEFPIGSVIVKEKQENQTEDSVKIITAMKKLKAGNKENSWDYRLYDVTAWQELKQLSFSTRTKATPTPSVKCIDCHKRYRENDYISPTGMYLFFPKS
jgi:hypothetical protein